MLKFCCLPINGGNVDGGIEQVHVLIVAQASQPHLLWIYFMGVPSTMPRSGKPGWPIDGDVACGPSGGLVAVDPKG
jgi:hypothetical protein